MKGSSYSRRTPRAASSVGPLGGQGQAEWRVVGAEHLARMRLEGQHRERGLRPRRVGRADQGGVAAVHPVEIAERHGGAARLRRQVAPVAEDVHQPRAGTWTSASPSITTSAPTVQVVFRVARCFSALSAVTSTVATTVAPIFTGARKRRVWLM